jgi:hypothetical protein
MDPEGMPKGYPKDGQKRRLSSANRCAVCRHTDRPRIEALRCTGVSFDRLSEHFDLHRDAIWRHMERRVSEESKVNYLIGASKMAVYQELGTKHIPPHSFLGLAAIGKEKEIREMAARTMFKTLTSGGPNYRAVLRALRELDHAAKEAWETFGPEERDDQR